MPATDMKMYFRYDRGYVNVDEENIYLNNTGNWADAKKAGEKSRRTNRKNRWRIFRVRMLIYLLYLLAVLAFMRALDSQVGSLTGLLMILALAVKVYRSFVSETGKRIKIPIRKIQYIEEQEGTFVICFRDADGELETEAVSGAEPHGQHALENLGLHIISLDNKLATNSW